MGTVRTHWTTKASQAFPGILPTSKAESRWTPTTSMARKAVPTAPNSSTRVSSPLKRGDTSSRHMPFKAQKTCPKSSPASVVASATVSKTPIQYQYLLLVGALRVPVAPPMQVAVADMAASIHRTRAGCRTRTFAISFLETLFLN